MKTLLSQFIDIIPNASEIKQYIFENDPDEKMLDEWLWERMYKKDWLNLEKQQIINAYETGDKYKLETSGEHYFNETYK